MLPSLSLSFFLFLSLVKHTYVVYSAGFLSYNFLCVIWPYLPLPTSTTSYSGIPSLSTILCFYCATVILCSTYFVSYQPICFLHRMQMNVQNWWADSLTVLNSAISVHCILVKIPNHCCESTILYPFHSLSIAPRSYSDLISHQSSLLLCFGYTNGSHNGNFSGLFCPRKPFTEHNKFTHVSWS